MKVTAEFDLLDECDRINWGRMSNGVKLAEVIQKMINSEVLSLEGLDFLEELLREERVRHLFEFDDDIEDDDSDSEWDEEKERCSVCNSVA